MRKPTLQFSGLLTAVRMLPALVWAAQMTGKVQSISRKASTIQMMNLKTKAVNVVHFSKSTKFINAKSIKEFIVNDKIILNLAPRKTSTADQACPGQDRPQKGHRYQGSCYIAATSTRGLPDRRCKTEWQVK